MNAQVFKNKCDSALRVFHEVQLRSFEWIFVGGPRSGISYGKMDREAIHLWLWRMIFACSSFECATVVLASMWLFVFRVHGWPHCIFQVLYKFE